MKLIRRELFFFISYICLCTALFLGDVYETNIILTMTQVLRKISYIVILFELFNCYMMRKDVILFGILLTITFAYGCYTKNWYWSILLFFIYESKNIKSENLLRINIAIIFSGIFLIIGLCLLGVLPDILTARDSSIPDSFTRHSFGFYHSNVLPLLVLYLEIYYILLMGEKIQYFWILFFLILHSILFYFCNSRNAFGLGVLLSTLILVERRIRISSRIKKRFSECVALVVPILASFSLAVTYLINKGGIWDVIDTIFSGRFRLATFKIRRVGIHIVNFMSTEEFQSDSIQYVNNRIIDTVVLDNGYLFIIIRYGILAILFYFIVSRLLVNKTRENIYELTAILIVFLVNLVDNDLVDYCFLPFILIAFNNFPEIIHNSKGSRRIKAE